MSAPRLYACGSCSVCGGAGRVMREGYDHDLGYHAEPVECLACEATGDREIELAIISAAERARERLAALCTAAPDVWHDDEDPIGVAS